MSDPNLPAPRKAPLIDVENVFTNLPQLVYLLYLLGFVVAPASLAGIIIAYLNRNQGDEVDRSHYEFQIATFWRALVIAIAGIVLMFVLVGWLVFIFLAVWMIVRCVRGLTNLSQRKPMPDTTGWGFG